MAWLTPLTLVALAVGVIYFALPWGAKLIFRKRFLKTVGKSQFIFLTFDDGPSKEATPQILELLKRDGVKATFFLLGKNVKRSPDIAQMIVGDGHEIGEHSYAHTHAWRSGPFKTLVDLVRGGRTIKNLPQFRAHDTAFRPPFGKLNLISLLYIWYGRKKVVFWNVDPRDYASISSTEVANHVLRDLKAGDVILLHDGRYQNSGNYSVPIESLKMILEATRKKDFKFAAIRESTR
jgi:peptidoglycan/xylan/chitin deacetylase (PgdA/CDA1 family)